MMRMLRWKRLHGMLGCLLIVALLFAPAAGARAGEPTAVALEVTVAVNNKALDMAALRDGSDETGTTFKRAKELTLKLTPAQGEEVCAVAARLSVAPEAVTIKRLNDKKKYDDVATFTQPGADFVLRLPAPLSGSFVLALSFSDAAAVTLEELTLYGAGALPASARAFVADGRADVLYVADRAASVDLSLVAAWMKAGRTVRCYVLGRPEAGEHALSDALWALGCDRYPGFADWAETAVDVSAERLQKLWPEAALQRRLVSAIRRYQPSLVAYSASGSADDVLPAALAAALPLAAEYGYETDDAVAHGLWVAQGALAAESESCSQAVAALDYDGNAALRARCKALFADAVYADPALIPWPDACDANGFLTEGEFLYEDADNGLWAYASPTVRVEIVRYEQPDVPRRWYVSDVRFAPESESFCQHLYTKAAFDGQQTYPETLAQTSRLVFGINGDYYIYREDKGTTGNIIRNRAVLYNRTKRNGYPNLDTVALRDDGSMTIYATGEITADALLQQGDVHDALSFGPYLVRDGALRVWNGKGYDATEPRNALGMVAPGHYRVVTVEGRFAKGYGPAGMTVNMLGALLYAQDVEQGINLDGGNTAVLIFMGEKLNRTASKGGHAESSSRNMHELFGVGTSELVHTDKLNGID